MYKCITSSCLSFSSISDKTIALLSVSLAPPDPKTSKPAHCYRHMHFSDLFLCKKDSQRAARIVGVNNSCSIRNRARLELEANAPNLSKKFSVSLTAWHKSVSIRWRGSWGILWGQIWLRVFEIEDSDWEAKRILLCSQQRRRHREWKRYKERW